MHLFFKNYAKQIGIPRSKPLEASIWQALEIFDDLPENDDSYLGLINSKKEVLKFVKHNKFVWLVEMPVPQNDGAYLGYYTRARCREIIEKVFKETPFRDIPGLKFKKH